MTTALDIITGAAKLIGAVFKSESLSADEAADGLVSLNDMMASWANNGLLVISRTWENFNVSAASSYAIGASQTLNTVRPIAIKKAFFRIDGIDYQMEPLSDEQYEDIDEKSLSSTVPMYFSYDNAHPYGTIRIYPGLSSSAALHLLSEKAITSFASISTTVDLPPGWNRALRFNLALEIAGEYGAEVPQWVVRGAGESLSAIQLAIAKNRPMKFDPRPPQYPTGDIRIRRGY